MKDIKNAKDEMIYTSINLPNWQLARIFCVIRKISGENIYSIIEFCVNRYLECRHFTVTRERAHMYNKSPSKYEKISVYWDIEFYNKLRMRAHHGRMSASLLIHLALLDCLMEILKDQPTKIISYQNIIVELNSSVVRILEKIEFLDPPEF